jgi:hypothetical protein
MEITDLTEDERLALVAVARRVAEADTYVTDPEAQQLRAIIKALGEKAYRDACDVVDRRFEDAEQLKTFLRGIERQAARELIYSTGLALSLSDSGDRNEKEILEWLSHNWRVKMRIAEEKGTA